MPLSDTSITDWSDDYTVADSNTPTDSQLINGQLDDEVRNIKSVVRAESRAKDWQRSGFAATYSSASVFTLAGDKRTTAVIGRRLKASCGARTVYGYVSNSSYAANTTTVTIEHALVKFTDTSVLTLNSNTIYFSGNFNTSSYFRVTQVGEVWNASNERAPIRWVLGDVSYNGTHTLVSFSASGAAPDMTVFTPTTMLWRGNPEGLDANLTVVDFGAYTPDTFQSGLPHRTLGGTFNLVLNNTTGPWTVNFPTNADTGSIIALNTTSYVVQVQPTGIVSGSPNTVAWANPVVSARTTTNFNITLVTAVNAGTVQYDYYISLGN